MRRGQIYWVNLEPSDPPEFGKTRPCVVISGTLPNQTLKTVAIVPLSTQPPEIWPLRIPINIPQHKIKISFAVIPGIRQVSKHRFLDCLGQVPVDQMKSLDEAIQIYLSD